MEEQQESAGTTEEAPEGQAAESGQEPSTPSTPDYTSQFNELKTHNQRLEEQNRKILEDLTSHKEELSRRREEERKRNLILAGDKSAIEAENENARKQRIKNEFFNLFPNAKSLLENENNNQSQTSVAEMAFYNTARQKGFELAKTAGFTSSEGQQLMPIIADVLIQHTPQWKQRFYAQGDMSVIDEVSKYLEEKVFGPRDKAVEAKILARIQKQGRYVAPVPPKSGGSSGSQNNQEKYDFKKSDDRHRLYGKIYQKSVSG